MTGTIEASEKKTDSRRNTSLTLTTLHRKAPPPPVKQLTFREIVQCTGRKDDGFYVIDSARFQCGLSALRPFKTDDLSFFVVDKGALTLKLDVGVHTLTAGSILAKRPSAIVQVQEASADCHFRIFGFSSGFVHASGLSRKHLEALSLLALHTAPHRRLNADEAAGIFPILDLLQQKHYLEKKPLHYDESVYHAFCLFALELASGFRLNENEQWTALTRKEHLAYEFFRQLPGHVQKERSVNHYASLLHVTPKHLSKTIKEVTGKTSSRIIDEMLLQEAKVLLDDPTLSVSEVADRLNFSDQFTFSKFFKKHTALPPSVYRTAI